MWTDNHCWAENNYRNIKEHNNKFSISNDMPLFYTFCDQPLIISATLYFYMQFY